MPGPIGYLVKNKRHPGSDGALHWDASFARSDDDLTIDALITTDQAEAYKDACVRAALELAYQSAREVEKNLLADHLQHVSGPAAVSYAANRIRALITIMTTNRRTR